MKTEESRQKISTFLDFNENIEEMVYCSPCYKVNVLSVLQPRLYANEIPLDAHLWKMCYRCGKIYSVSSVKHMSEIEEIVQPVKDNDPHFANTEDIDKKKPKHQAGISRYNDRRRHKTTIDPDIELAIKTYGEDRVRIHQE